MLGILLTVGGVYTMYTYIIGLDSRANVILLIISIVAICAGVSILVIAGKSDTIILKRVSQPELDKNPIISTPNPSSEDNPSLASKLEENNKLLKDWKKTNETKERLRMLEIQASAEE